MPDRCGPTVVAPTRKGGSALPLGEVFADVLHAARSGAPWALERLYADLAPAVTGYLRVQRAAEPEDLVSEVFLGVFRGIGSFQGTEQQFRSWVFTIAHRRLIDERRRAARRPHLESYGADRAGGDVEREAFDALGQQWVVRVCGQLSADQRTVVLLRVVADLSVPEVARVTGKSAGAVKALQRRALEVLRRRLAREGVLL